MPLEIAGRFVHGDEFCLCKSPHIFFCGTEGQIEGNISTFWANALAFEWAESANLGHLKAQRLT